MSRYLTIIIRLSFATTILTFVFLIPSFASELQMFSNVRLIDNPDNDGDSFHLGTNGKLLHVRLYYVDCPETSIGSKSDAQRVKEQMRYFGLFDAERIIHFGNEATGFVERTLSNPFTLYTAFASAMGRSSKGRVYGFIVTADGEDLARLLVKKGFARTHGIGRETPSGTARNEMVERLHDLEISAMLKGSGIWSESDPDHITELRAKQRKEERELQELQSQVKKATSPKGLLDLNTATEKELQSIKGIGPVLASRIIAGRPYKTVDDLLKIKGIGHKKFEQMRPYFVTGKE